MKYLCLALLMLIVLLIGCGSSSNAPSSPTEEETGGEMVPNDSLPVAEPAPVETAPKSCAYTSDCDQRLQCIDGVCGTIFNLYSTNCQNKCNFKEVVVRTNDGESYTLSRGQGSYSYAGAVEWKIMTGPDYCPNGDTVVPLAIIKKTTGTILDEQVLTLHKGETSKIVTHPTIPRVAFTVTVQDLKEVCS